MGLGEACSWSPERGPVRMDGALWAHRAQLSPRPRAMSTCPGGCISLSTAGLSWSSRWC